MIDTLTDLYWRWRWVKALRSAVEDGDIGWSVRKEYVILYNQRKFWWMKELR